MLEARSKGLERIGELRELVVERNRSLISLAGLAGVRRARSVRIVNNPRLCADFGLLPALVVVEERLVLSSNAGLSESDVQNFRLGVQVGLPKDGTFASLESASARP